MALRARGRVKPILRVSNKVALNGLKDGHVQMMASPPVRQLLCKITCKYELR